MYTKRRDFLKLSASVIISVASPLVATVKDNTLNLDEGEFLHGVASGDPQKDKVIIWTRVTQTSNLDSIRTLYEVSKNKDFKNIYRRDIAFALRENDYTIKIDLQELQAGTEYYYRFRTDNSVSEIGRTKTLPIKTDKVVLAAFSCANYTSGYFNVYKDASSFKQIDAVIHLGDYIYEYGMLDENSQKAYGTKNAQAIGRELPKESFHQLITLQDYRSRYALYRSDIDLQNLHKEFPFIVIWDDHEIANNVYSNGLSNKQQKLDAIKAYYEWLPIRPPYIDKPQKIYRSFDFGELFSLYMLDTRLVAREKQLDYNDYIDDEELNLEKFENDLKKSRLNLLGDEQFQWLEAQLQNSSAKWKILAQQVKLSPSYIPLEVVRLQIKYQNAKSFKEKELLKHEIFTVFEEIGRIKARYTLKDTTLKKEEIDRLQHNLPYNLDAWDGYPNEREKLYTLLEKYRGNTVVLSGDTHYSWSNKLVNNDDEMIGIELGVTSVSSPGLEEDYNLKDKVMLERL